MAVVCGGHGGGDGHGCHGGHAASGGDGGVMFKIPSTESPRLSQEPSVLRTPHLKRAQERKT